MSDIETFIVLEGVDEEDAVNVILKESATLMPADGSVYVGTHAVPGKQGTYLTLMMSGDLTLEGYLEPVLIAHRYYPDRFVLVFQETEMGSITLGLRGRSVVYELNEGEGFCRGRPNVLAQMPDFGAMDDIEDRDDSYGNELFITRYQDDFGELAGDYMRWINFNEELNWYAVYENGKPADTVNRIDWLVVESRLSEEDLYRWPAELIR